MSKEFEIIMFPLLFFLTMLIILPWLIDSITIKDYDQQKTQFMIQCHKQKNQPRFMCEMMWNCGKSK